MILTNTGKRTRSARIGTSAVGLRRGLCALILASAIGPVFGQVTTPVPASAPASAESKLVERLDEALARKQFATTLELIAKAKANLRSKPPVCCRAAEAHLGLGRPFGKCATRVVHDGRIGQFDAGWVLVEKRSAADEFLCAPPDSALGQVRRAIDAGCDEPRVHVLHARVWLKAGQPETAWSILRAREALLLDEPSEATLGVFAEVSLARGAVDDFLRYSNRRAECAPERRVAILHAAYLAVAERYNERGEADLNREFLRRALALKSEQPELMLQLADALWESGEKGDAARWYRKVIDVQPAHLERNRILERIGE